MKQNQSLTLVVLASLLHDVGKFAQRAEAPCSTNMEHEFCPFNQSEGYHTHKHVLYTDYFIEHDLLLPEELETKRSYLARLASVHHKPAESVYEECCIMRGDRLSSGGDRIEGDPQGSYKKARLESIFSSVCLGNVQTIADKNPLRYRLLTLDDDTEQAIFPVEGYEKPSYAELYAEFKESVRKIPLDMGIRHYIHSLATVLERYTWCIPSSTYGTRADISLYDHSWTTATISQALLCLKDSAETSEKFLIYGGDISGIQKYIFGTEDISGKGANKLLRARSFLLQALVRSIWTELLERVSLYNVAKIMDAGGRFVLLLPASDTVKNTISQLEYEVEEYMLQKFQGIVRMTFASLEIQTNDLERERFQECFEMFNNRLEQAKLAPFKRLMANHVSPVLPVDHAAYAKYDECVACRMCPASGSSSDEFEADTEKSSICNGCDTLIHQIGRRLPTAYFMLLERKSGGLPLFGGLSLCLLKEKELSPKDRDAVDIINLRDRNAYSALPVAGYIPVIDKEQDIDRWKGEKRLKGQDGAYTFAGEECAAGMPKTFVMLAQESCILQTDRTWRGIPSMAACKADVDNLGLLFGVGFGIGKESTFSISRIAMLSRMLNHFFASHLIRLIEKEFPNLYVVFAGGDDLFVLGPWADIVRFAKRMQEDFTAFSGNNPDLTLSAGIPLFKPRLPMRGIAHMAEEAEQLSKNYFSKDAMFPTKNAVTLFGVTAAWHEFDALFAQGGWLEDLCLNGAITQGLVRRLLGYAKDCQEFQDGSIEKGLYLSHMAYDFARNCDEKRMSAEDVKRLKQLGHEQTFPKTSMSVTWALYRTRTSA